MKRLIEIERGRTPRLHRAEATGPRAGIT